MTKFLTLSVEILLNKKKKVISRVLTYVVLKKINLFNIWHEKYVMVLIQI